MAKTVAIFSSPVFGSRLGSPLSWSRTYARIGSSLVDGEGEQIALVAQDGLGGLQGTGQGGGGHIAEVVDVQALAPGEVEDAFAQLGRAGAGVGAAEVDVGLLHRA